MKKVATVLIAVLMFSTFIITPVSAIADDDIFLDAGFIKARKKVAAMDFTLEDLEGRKVSLTDFRGKAVLLFFWTTW
ncbi:MAG: redoxin domain-containing protein [Deltaproteobacteria bacterium]|nr:redoxin domain-containing protein [Deltaproteobacteria bacterium]